MGPGSRQVLTCDLVFMCSMIHSSNGLFMNTSQEKGQARWQHCSLVGVDSSARGTDMVTESRHQEHLPFGEPCTEQANPLPFGTTTARAQLDHRREEVPEVP